jgi:FlaA1/EpsC-like NDP-sugar epimerase
MVVLVTGAGGSIGSEICRQVARLGAGELVLLGNGENSIFDIHNELLVKHPGLRVVPVVADIRNAARLLRIFRTFRPDAVFHAAAHKHVPLMEQNPEEAVTNNVLGTRNMLEAVEAAGVSHFVLISTDKAVNPANTMGTTKLLAEALVHDAAVRTGACYVSVRFGNVLASRGSVVPLFQQQIRAGGPVTVTHPDMTRYFMTIPEAVQLVLQAAAMGTGGETFVLDMGQPVKILDLAKDLIKLTGLELGQDIEITFSGLRPGEKLNEELFAGAEHVDRTAHEKIYVARNGDGVSADLGRIEELIVAARNEDTPRVLDLLAALTNGDGATQPEVHPRLKLESGDIDGVDLEAWPGRASTA